MSINKYNEVEALTRLKNGDEEAFAIIYSRYAEILWSFLEKFNLSTPDVEDSIQTTFVKVWENRQNIDTQKSFKNYLITLAKNDIYNKVKRSIIEKKYLNDIIPSNSEFDNSKELNFILLRILDQLPEKRARVFKMSRLEGYKNDEIAKELGISKSTVENHINNSSSLIKKILKNLGFIFLSFFSNFS